MSQIDYIELRKQEEENIEKNALAISRELRTVMNSSFKNVFAVAYLAYLISTQKVNSWDELQRHICSELGKEDKHFWVKMAHAMRDERTWRIIRNIAYNYTLENLLAIVLWLSPSSAVSFERTEGIDGTPYGIVKLVDIILDIKDGEEVANFYTKNGDFLTYSSTLHKKNIFTGCEIDPDAKAIATIRASFVSESVNIDLCPAFLIYKKCKYDKIFCEYPWNQTKLDIGRPYGGVEVFKKLENYMPELKGITKGDPYYVANMIMHLKKGGKAAVMVPTGFLWNGVFKRFREGLVNRGILEAVISLPENLFGMSNIATSVLIFSNKKNKEIRLIEAKSKGIAGRKRNILADETIEEIVEMLNVDSDSSKSFTIDEIRKNDYNLNPTLYFMKEEKIENGVRFGDIILNITRGTSIMADDLFKLKSEVPTKNQYLTLADIQDGIINDDLPYLTEIEPKLGKYCLKNHSLIMSKSNLPAKIAVAEIEEGRKVLATGNLFIIELYEARANPYFIKTYLESKHGEVALTRIVAGTSVVSISVDQLKKITVPVPGMEVQNKIANEYRTKRDEVKLLRVKLEKALEELKNIYDKGEQRSD